MAEIQSINQYCNRNKEEYRFKPAQDIYLSTLFNGIFSRVVPSSIASPQELKQDDSPQLSSIMIANKNLIRKGRFQVSPVSLPQEIKLKNDMNAQNKVNSTTVPINKLDQSLGRNGGIALPLSSAKVDAPPFDPDSLDYYDDDDSNDVFIPESEKSSKKELSVHDERRSSDVSLYYSKQCQHSPGLDSPLNSSAIKMADSAVTSHTKGKSPYGKRKDLVLNLISQSSTELAHGENKERRLSSPTVSSTEPHVFRKAHNIKCCKALEGLDLCSSMPISPTRLYENFSKWIFTRNSVKFFSYYVNSFIFSNQ